MRKPGCIEPVFYFVSGGFELTNPARPAGYVLIAPYSDCPAPDGYRRESTDTLAGVDKLERILVQQERDGWEQEAQLWAARDEAHDKSIRDKLHARIASSGTDEWEKEFLRLYLQLKDERKRERYRQLYLERTAFLWARHNDTPKNRGVDEEKVSLDRINF